MKSLFSVFQRGLQKTATAIGRTFTDIFTDTKQWDAETYKKLETALIAADFGLEQSQKITADIKDRYQRGLIKVSADMKTVAAETVCEILKKSQRQIEFAPGQLTVILMVGVNGSGKTTTIGKLAHLWNGEGRKVVLAACDTFRAAAVEQLKLWAAKTSSPIISSFQGADPSAVAFDAVQAALARKSEILLIDTAGRQHTKKSLMDELSKMKRTIAKVYPGAPHEVWLTIDSSIGVNSLKQAEEFSKAAEVSGLVITKLDGTGRGGIAVAIKEKFNVPVFFVGLGEQPDDLQPFEPAYYSEAIFSEKGMTEASSSITV